MGSIGDVLVYVDKCYDLGSNIQTLEPAMRF
jgi:hypothetical protein